MRIINYIKKLNKVAKANKKCTLILIIDVAIWYIFYGATLTDYLNYEFYNKNFKERKTYAVVKTQNLFYEKVSPSLYKEYFTVKPNFLNNFKDYIGREYYIPDMGIKKLEKFLKNNREFMIKPIDGLGGAGVEKLKSSEIENTEEFFNKLKNGRCFLEEVIKQHKKLNELCRASVNTLRIMTYANKGESKILFMALRVGNGYHAVDNFHKGGMGIAIDMNTGKLVGNGTDKDLVEYSVHPLTKCKFDGFKIPYFDEIKDLVLKCALVNENIHVVGWDVAITDKGPVLVEGNRRPGFDIVQVVSKRGRMDIINEVLGDFNE